MTIISVDLAYKNYRDIGIVVLKETDEHIAVETIRLSSVTGFAGHPDVSTLANFLSTRAVDVGATAILIDGSQAWKSAANGLEHSRRCEKDLATPGKTGLPGITKPANYLRFIEFSIDLFNELGTLGWPRLTTTQPPVQFARLAVESFPTAAWRCLGLTPLPGKNKASVEAVTANLDALCELFQLMVDSRLSHDEVQALVAGMAGLALARGDQAGFALAGTSPVTEDGQWREGYIITPTRDTVRTLKPTRKGRVGVHPIEPITNDRLKLEHNQILGRMLRVDDLETLGVSTQTLAEDAIQAGRVDEAVALVDYFHQEMRIMHTIMHTWLTDITRYIVVHGSGANDPGQIGDLSYTLFDIWRTYPFGEAVRERCKAAIREGEVVQAIDLLDHMRLEFKVPHDVLVAWVQNLLTTIAVRWGEEAVLESIQETHQSIWGDRYENWAKMTPHEKMALTVEGMRGGHFSGERRRGDMTLRDDGDRLVMSMELCGSGGVLRRGDPESGRLAYPVGDHGVNRQAHDWTWQKTGIHWYCSHCAIAMEWLPARRNGRLLRPLDHVMDPNAPCTWYVYKDEDQTRAYHYPRTRSPILPSAPDHGEDWQAEYPGGS